MKQIFVFGSNLSGIHGKGAAKYALQHKGAIWGKGVGLQGNSYAIPTKDIDVKTPLSLDRINDYVNKFILFANENENLYFFEVTPIGCGYAGYKPEQIAPMFYPLFNNFNIKLPNEFTDILFQRSYFNIFEY